jgi:hypothetical protein
MAALDLSVRTATGREVVVGQNSTTVPATLDEAFAALLNWAKSKVVAVGSDPDRLTRLPLAVLDSKSGNQL